MKEASSTMRSTTHSAGSSHTSKSPPAPPTPTHPYHRLPIEQDEQRQFDHLGSGLSIVHRVEGRAACFAVLLETELCKRQLEFGFVGQEFRQDGRDHPPVSAFCHPAITRTTSMLADGLTKPLPPTSFARFLVMLGSGSRPGTSDTLALIICCKL